MERVPGIDERTGGVKGENAMELENAPKENELLVKKSALEYLPTCMKVTFEIPIEVGERFLRLCDRKKEDPDEVVARLISDWMRKKEY